MNRILTAVRPDINARRGQVLIISLWILAFLTVLAVSLGHRAAMGLKLSQYQVDKLKTLALAKAGVNAAVAAVSLEELSSWKSPLIGPVDRNDLAEIRAADSDEGYAAVTYRYTDDGADRTVSGVFDEEKKININKASPQLINGLLRTLGYTDERLALNICAWRGDSGVEIPNYSEEGYANKGAPFASVEELSMVKGIGPEVYEKLKDHVTIWGEGLVNINTASRVVVSALIAYGRDRITVAEDGSRDLADRIMLVRPVGSLEELMDKLQSKGGLKAGDAGILNEMAAVFGVLSTHMHIFSTGRLANSKVATTVECVMDRGKGRIVYWHES